MEDFTAIAVYSDLEETLAFDSSNQLLNRFVECPRWSAKNNSADLPTDCPTRERHGWTGDAQIFFNTAGYLFQYAPFARKYERDMTDWQREDGCFPHIAPEGGSDPYMYPMNGSVGWADAGVMIPYRYWKLYGDRQILEENYEAMKRYAHFVMKRCGKRHILAKNLGLKGEAKRYAVNTGQSYGEWAEPLDVLEEVDLEAAYRLLENEEMPGWLFMPKAGATTIWESWEGTCAQGGIASLNHYSKGACCEWVFRSMCGIRVDGENRFLLAPEPGGHFAHAKTTYRSVYGEVSCGWEKNRREQLPIMSPFRQIRRQYSVIRMGGNGSWKRGFMKSDIVWHREICHTKGNGWYSQQVRGIPSRHMGEVTVNCDRMGIKFEELYDMKGTLVL